MKNRSENKIDYNYILITAAKNEEKYIENTIKAVIAQTCLPVKWIIVSDGSTDRTDEIILQYSTKYDFITFLRKTANIDEQIDFSSKVHAIMMGYEKRAGLEYGFIGILDADVTFDPLYYERVLRKFAENSKLGIVGGIILDQYDNHCIRRSPRNANYVSGCIQLFRGKCYEDIGGLFPIKEGGEDTVAVYTALMKGWEVEAIEELEVYHHKHGDSLRDSIKYGIREGKMLYALGGHPLFEISKIIKDYFEKHSFLFSFPKICSYVYLCFQKQKRPVSDEFIKFLRKEQWTKLKTVFIKKGKQSDQISGTGQKTNNRYE